MARHGGPPSDGRGGEASASASASAPASSGSHKMKKSTKCTVFVRMVPTPQEQVSRHALENHFSQVGPIKKSSWISSSAQDGTSKGYGFVKYMTEEDAAEAASSFNETQLSMNGELFQLKVQSASAAASAHPNAKPAAATDADKPKQRHKPLAPSDHEATKHSTFDERYLKKHARIIVRNLSFYANARQIQTILQDKYGPIVDIHLPMAKSNLHVGFCFVTFANPKYAKQAVEDTSKIEVKKRTLQISWSVPKQMHERNAQLQKEAKKAESDKQSKADKGNRSDDDSGSDSDDDNDDNDKEDDDESDSDDQEQAKSKSKADMEDDSGSDDSDNDDDDDDDDESDEDDKKDEGVEENRTLFLGNLPFDATRHDVFQLFYKFGHIVSIFLVKDNQTGMNKGTAFIEFAKQSFAAKVLETVSTGSGDATDKSKTMLNQSDLTIRGRPVMISLAVNRETASTFSDKDQQKRNTDRRNLYLRSEDRVGGGTEGGDVDSWQFLPDKDKQKRQISDREKTTKLKSPLFFINPFRLSFKNLAKHVDELALQQLCARAVKKALKSGLVTADDQVKHWQASGELSTRDILDLVKQKEADNEEIIPSFQDKLSKELLPSVFISRDMVSGLSKRTKQEQPSRGFGFIEFKYHVHALACLRELNNNKAYSAQYVAGGKGPQKKQGKKQQQPQVSGPVLSRLIVDFTVENRVKVEKQLKRRVAQQINSKKQHIENKLKSKEQQQVKQNAATDDDNNAKKSRGARQRERKRKQRLEGTKSNDETPQKKPKAAVTQTVTDDEEAHRPRRSKSPKKKGKKAATAATDTTTNATDMQASTPEPKKSSGARWFD